jgi:hypothetical protein
MRPPSLEHLAAEPVLGSLSVLQMALAVLSRALRGMHDVDCLPSRSDEPQTTAARQLVDACERLLHALDDYRDHVYERLRPRTFPDPDWPF